MKYPNLAEEKKLWKKGFKKVACLDEAGRGPLAGPVVAAAAIFQQAKLKNKNKNLKLEILLREVKDSKQLSPKKREKLYNLLTKNSYIKWGIGKVSEKVIDKINIFQATKLAMQKAINNLKIKPDFLILDGNFKISSRISQKPIIKADQKVFSCSAASIIAKVTRDRIMGKYHKKYPKYGFKKHKGYPTKFHFKMLKKYGPCRIHRKTFWPVKKFFV
jgi:ribonuclease HII